MSGWSPWEQSPAIESVRVLGVDLRCGDRVILRPNIGGDIMDLALAGRITDIRVGAGNHVESGAVLAVIEPAS